MKQIEADLIAKGIRNLDVSLEDKKRCVNFICEHITQLDQFFNTKRFHDIALSFLPKDFYNKSDKWVTSITYKGNKEDKP